MARDETIEIRVTADEREAILQAAKRDGRTISDFMRRVALAKAKEPEK